MSPHLETIRGKVSALRRRILLIDLLEGMSLLGALWLLFWMIGPVPLSFAKGWPEIIWRICVLAAAGGILLFVIARLVMTRHSEDRLALRIENVYPELNNSLISSLQLARERENPDPHHKFSGYLLDRLIQQTASGMPGVDLSMVVKPDRAKWKFFFLCLALIAFIVIHNLFPGYFGKGFERLVLSDFNIPRPAGPSRAAISAEALTTGDFTLEYVYPAYSGLEPQVVRHTSGEISALKGTEVSIETTCLERVASANLVLGGSARIPMEVEEGSRLSGRLVVSDYGGYFIEAQDLNKEHRAEPEGHLIHIEDDLYPGITLKEPISDMEVNAEDVIRVAFEAEDDFGVGSVSLVFHRGAEEKRVEIYRPEEATRREEGGYDWDLYASGVVPGERISFYLEVEDNDNISGPKKSRSATLYLDVYSAFKKHEEVIASQEDLFEEMIVHLAEHLEDSSNHDNPPAGYVVRDAEEELIRKGRVLVSHIEGVLEMAEEDEYSTDLIRDSLRNMAEVYVELLDRREELTGRLTRASRPGNNLRELRRKYIETLEGDIIFLDRMIKKQRLDWAVIEGKNLARAQQELSDLLDRYKKTGDPALLEELQRKMAELEAAFMKLMARMAQMRSEMGDEYFNPEAFEGPGLKDVLEQMSRMRNSIQDGDIASALSQAESFLDALSQMMAALEENAGEYGEMVSSDALRRMDDVIDRLAKLESMEQDLIDQTGEIYHRQLERSADIESMLEPLIAGELEKMDELSQKLAELQNGTRGTRPKKSPGTSTEEFQNTARDFFNRRNSLYQQTRMIQSQLGQTREKLEGAELDEALEAMKMNQSNMELMEQDLDALFERFQVEPQETKDRASGQCQSALSLGQEIIEDIERMRRSVRAALSAEDAERMKSLADGQEKIREQTLDVWEEIEDIAMEIPAIPSGTGAKLDKAALSMRDASGYMLLEEPGSALAPERDAKSSLQQAREDLEQAQKQLSEMAQAGGGLPMGSGGAMGGRGGRGSDGLTMKDFQIPRAGGDEDQGDLREALLKAMREDAPEEYRNLNHDYYERLMR